MAGRFHTLAVLGLIALAAALYSGTIDDEWHYDDRTELSSKVRELAPSIDPSHYRGIVVRWSWAADYRWHGEDPAGYHVTNVAIHALNAVLVYWIAWMLAARAVPARRRFTALVTATVFCAHPLATQSVSYLTQRSTSLAALLFLAALGGWIRLRTDGGRGGRVAGVVALLAFALGLHAKHFVVMLPAVLLAWELLFRPPRRRLGLVLLVPFVLLAAWRSWEYVPWVVRSSRAEAPAAAEVRSAVYRAHTSLEYAVSQPRSVATYLRLFVWPRGQNLDWDVRPSRSVADPAVLGSLAVLAALTALAWRQRRRRPTIPFGVALFFLVLVPTSSFVWAADLLYEHRAYLPMAGLCLALGELAGAAYAVRPRGALAAAVLLVAALSAATVRRNDVWDSELALWSDVVARSPGKARGHLNLGMALQRAGRLDDAARHYRQALEIEPRDPSALANLGNVLRRQGRPAESEAAYRRAVEQDPGFVEPRIGLGNLAVDRGDFAQAERHYREALALAPGDAIARYNLAKALEGQGRIPEAIAEYDGLAREHPGDARYLNDRGAARLSAGDAAGAERDLRRAIEVRAGWDVPWYNLGLALEAQGRPEEAEAARRESRRIASGAASPGTP